MRVDVVADHATTRQGLSALLDDLRTSDAAPADALVVVVGDGPWAVTSPGHHATVATLDALRGAVLTAINLTVVQSTPHLAVHAAVVSRDGTVLVIPAASGHGKSTLTAALLQRGWRYVSDEALCLPWDGSGPLAYPRPLSLSRWSAAAVGVSGGHGEDATGEETIIGIARQGWSVEPAPGTVTDIALLTRDAGTARLEPAHPSDVVTELLRRSFTHFLDPRRAVELLARTASTARCHRMHLGDPREAAGMLTAAC